MGTLERFAILADGLLQYHTHHHCAAMLSRGWAKASACCFHICLSCAILCQMLPFQYSSSSFLHRLAGLSLGLFLSYGFQVVIRSVHRLSRILLQYINVVYFTAHTPSFGDVTTSFVMPIDKTVASPPPPTLGKLKEQSV